MPLSIASNERIGLIDKLDRYRFLSIGLMQSNVARSKPVKHRSGCHQRKNGKRRVSVMAITADSKLQL